MIASAQQAFRRADVKFRIGIAVGAERIPIYLKVTRTVIPLLSLSDTPSTLERFEQIPTPFWHASKLGLFPVIHSRSPHFRDPLTPQPRLAFPRLRVDSSSVQRA